MKNKKKPDWFRCTACEAYFWTEAQLAVHRMRAHDITPDPSLAKWEDKAIMREVARTIDRDHDRRSFAQVTRDATRKR